jgi:hypothetical protein
MKKYRGVTEIERTNWKYGSGHHFVKKAIYTDGEKYYIKHDNGFDPIIIDEVKYAEVVKTIYNGEELWSFKPY